MKWTDYSFLRGKHSFLSPSSPSWLNYDIEKLKTSYANSQQAVLGTRIHKLASELIDLNIRLPNTNATLNSFVNDAIGWRMSTEQTLYYSDIIFGTADAIAYENGVLRIHDLKTGVTPGKTAQLEIYAALFCLEYDQSPYDIDIILRIYQSDVVVEWGPETATVIRIMDKIVEYDSIVRMLKNGDQP